MSYFVPLDEDTIMQLWQQDPTLVMPFARPFLPANHVAEHIDSHVVISSCKQKTTTAQNTDSGSTCLPTLRSSSA